MLSRGKSDDAQGAPPSLSVVIPVFNEEDWIERSITALRAALANARWSAEIIVVNDGSTDETPKRLSELAQRMDLTVINQENRGRFAARRRGIESAVGDWVLLIDGRVLVDAQALVYLRYQLGGHPDRRVWNGHIHVASVGGPYGDFWAGLVAVAWRRYFANPRFVSFGVQEFDMFPKGTGFFAAPRGLLVAAGDSFSSLFGDVRFASDDTRMLRWIAQQEEIHIAPEFSAVYISRDSLSRFARHAYFRGTTFVDGYLDSPGPARRAAAAAVGLGALGLALLTRRPRAAGVLGIASVVGAGAAVRRCGGSAAQARAVAGLLPVFAVCFGSGVVRGLGLAVRRTLRR